MDKILNKKKIILIIGGGIAAYKSLDLIRLLKKQECEIKVVLTESGKKFVTPLSVTSLSQNKVYQDIFDSENEAEMDHISLSRWCDIILFAPITANSIAKLASGKADDLASTLILASNKQIILAPAMNVRMWLHKSTQSNIDKLLDFGYLSVGPSIGEMACGKYGEGKRVFEEAYALMKQKDSSGSEPYVNEKLAQKHEELADLYFLYKRFEEALENYNRAADFSKHHIKYKLKAVDSLISMKLLSRALREAEAVEAKNPYHVDLLLKIAQIHYQLGSHSKAEEYWEKVLSQDPKNDEAKSHLNHSQREVYI